MSDDTIDLDPDADVDAELPTTVLECSSCGETVEVRGAYSAGHAALEALRRQPIETGTCAASISGSHGWQFADEGAEA